MTFQTASTFVDLFQNCGVLKMTKILLKSTNKIQQKKLTYLSCDGWAVGGPYP